MLEHHACFKNWADELRKLSAANINSHLVLTKKSELNLNDKDVFPQAGPYQGGRSLPYKIFLPLLEKCVNHRSKLLDII